MTNFDDLGLDSGLLENIRARGFETPTPIQAEMIPFLLEESGDVVGLAQTGTGKTAAFGLPILQRIDPREPSTQALILAPTRELALQVCREISDYGRDRPGCGCIAVYGGAAFGPQIRELRRGAAVVIATPGRLRDLLEKGVVNLDSLGFLVLDEADRMLEAGFKDDLDTILQAVNPNRRTLLFSATMPPAVARIAAEYMNDPREIVAGQRNRGTENVSHFAYRVHSADKYAALRRLIDISPGMYGIVFCRTRESVGEITAKLGSDGYAVDSLHGDLSQSQREAVMRRFRQGCPELLVATDVAARGLDVNDLTHVVNYDLPDEPAAYNHRSGRTGRAGKTGVSLSLVHLREGFKIKRIERELGRKIEILRIPGVEDIREVRLNHFVERVLAAEADEGMLAGCIDNVRAKFDSCDREELLKRFIAAEFSRFFEDYRDAPDLNPRPAERSRREPGGMVRLRINLGRRESVLPPQLIGLINQASRSRYIRLGRIDIQDEWSDVQVEAGMADRVEQALRGFDYQGRRIRVTRGRDGRKGRPAPGPVEGRSPRNRRPGAGPHRPRKKQPGARKSGGSAPPWARPVSGPSRPGRPRPKKKRR